MSTTIFPEKAETASDSLLHCTHLAVQLPEVTVYSIHPHHDITDDLRRHRIHRPLVPGWSGGFLRISDGGEGLLRILRTAGASHT